MADWSTISSLATGAGTLVLAVATFASVRSSNRSARIAETALREQRRPVLVHSRLDDPVQKIAFAGGHWVRAEGAHAVVEHEGGVVYLALSLRNVGAGIGVLHGWFVWPEQQLGAQDHTPLEEFRMLTRDLLVPPGDIGLWQGALRDSDEEVHGAIARNAAARQGFSIDLLYGDQAGEQRWISRFAVAAVGEDQWLGSVVRHWNLDGSAPR
jgi:hypothetical protein